MNFIRKKRIPLLCSKSKIIYLLLILGFSIFMVIKVSNAASYFVRSSCQKVHKTTQYSNGCPYCHYQEETCYRMCDTSTYKYDENTCEIIESSTNNNSGYQIPCDSDVPAGSDSPLPSCCETTIFRTDGDDDGYGIHEMCNIYDDCEDTDPDIHPGAEEVCGDRITISGSLYLDNNCNGRANEGCSNPAPPDSGACQIGDPIDPLSGAYYYSETDIGYPYPSMVQIVRKYNSDNLDIGPFGVGTSINLNHRLLGDELAWEKLTYTTPEGGKYDMNFYIFYFTSSGFWGLTLKMHFAYTNDEYPFLNNVYADVSSSPYIRKLVFKDGGIYYFNIWNGWLELVEDRNGNQLYIDRDHTGTITGINDSFGRSLAITHIQRTVGGKYYTLIEKITDALGNEVVYEYDAAAKLVAVNLPNKTRFQYSYDRGMVSTVTRIDLLDDNEQVNLVENHYDFNGKILYQNRPGDIFPEFTDVVFEDSDADDIIDEVIVRDGGYSIDDQIYKKTIYELNKNGYVTSMYANGYTDNDETKSSMVLGDYAYSRDERNNIEKIESVYSGQPLSSYTYRSDGLINSVTDSYGAPTEYLYESLHPKPTKITDALGNTTRLEYDEKGNLTCLWKPGYVQPFLQITYRSTGLVNSVSNALGETTYFDYYSHGMIANIVDPVGQTHFEYDPIGRVTEITNPRGRTTSYEYYDGGREIHITDASRDVNKIKVKTDPEGNITHVDAKGKTVDISYTPQGNVKTYVDQLQQTETYSYLHHNISYWIDRNTAIANTAPYTAYALIDSADTSVEINYVEKDNSISTRKFFYYQNGRFGGGSDSKYKNYVYRQPVPGIVTWGDIRIEREERRDTQKTGEVVTKGVDYTYDAMGRRDTMTVDGQTLVDYDYYPDGGLKTIATTNPLDGSPLEFGFFYDAAGRRTSITYPNGVTASYGYDEAGRVDNIVYRDASNTVLEALTYTYYKDGNRKSFDRVGVDPILPGITNATYDAANRMLTFNGETLVHDANGNLTQKGDAIYTWDSRDQLAKINNSPAGTVSFKYDVIGRRTEKDVNEVVTKYLHDGVEIVEEMDAAYNKKAVYIRTLDIDEPLARIDFVNNNIRYYHADALGSVIALTDENGTVRTQYNYSPFGITEEIGEPSGNPFKFTGREHDETGDYYYRARYYSPEMGRFLSEDPIRFAAGDVNFYSYVGNSPLNWIDPLGFSSIVYDTENGNLTLHSENGTLLGTFLAGNNGRNPWPTGTYPFSWHSPHSESGPNDAFGSYGNFIFDVPDSVGRGVHSGRADQGGPSHPTAGCIRTTDEGTSLIYGTHYGGDPLTHIIVK